MTTRMLIDARHREETRVAVVKGNRIDEFDFESAERKQLKGNIYLAKVTRVEPSLQAAFIDYGGNRHGFLAFSEIHPDYYQIPKEDREALLREEAEHAAEEAALRAEQDDDDADGGDADEQDYDAEPTGGDLDHEDHDEADDGVHDDGAAGDERADDDDAPPQARRGRGNDEEVEALRQRRMNLRRRYKIQDVIRRRQVLLVQIVKEERGNKGAALTTYLSLAGRYCVLMPNTSHGGGISRKISNAGDRKRLKSIMADMKLPPSMGCIVRTAGLQRTKVEIKRDFDYLARLWDGIREQTLQSAAPAVVYGDSDLIKRAIRDIYNKDVEEVIVEGEDGYRHAKEFMRLLMPSHARRVKQYADAVPLFQRAGVEDQLAAMYNPVVQLKSGGYLVINPTEALVSIDINSGRSTREHNIEQTATATNLEAATEIARQLRLRDMAGLVVIDFIDMDNGSNVRKIEKAMKDALKDDRARIQVGRISSFGLMEMSRQRLRTGVLEASTRGCPHCEGTGLVRTASSAGLSALRLIEDEAARGRGSCITLRASQEAAVYVLNRKRADIAEIEDRYGVQVEILPDREEEGARMAVEASGPPPAHAPRIEPLVIEEDENDLDEVEDELDVVEDEAEEAGESESPAPRQRGRGRGREERAASDTGDAGGEAGRKRRRRRGRRNRGLPEEGGEATDLVAGDEGETDGGLADAVDGSEPELEFVGDAPGDVGNAPAADLDAPREEGEGGRRRRGRRGRRGGSRSDGRSDGRRGEGGEMPVEAVAEAQITLDDPDADADGDEALDAEPETIEAGDAGYVVSPLDIPTRDEDAKPKTRRRPRSRKSDEGAAEPATADAAPADGAAEVAGEVPAKPRRSRRKAAVSEVEAASVIEPQVDTGEPEAEPMQADAGESEAPAEKPKRRSRRKPAATDGDGDGDSEAGAPPAEPELPVIADAAEAPPAPPAAANDAEEAAGPDATALADKAAGESDDESDDPAAPPRRGWWQRTFGA